MVPVLTWMRAAAHVAPGRFCAAELPTAASWARGPCVAGAVGGTGGLGHRLQPATRPASSVFILATGWPALDL